jgi:hypothetical protein
MTFLILAETSAGYALFKAKDKKLLKKDDLAKEMSTPEGAAGLWVFSLHLFSFRACGWLYLLGNRLMIDMQVETQAIRKV